MEWVKVYTLSSNPSTAKKKKKERKESKFAQYKIPPHFPLLGLLSCFMEVGGGEGSHICFYLVQ
jgi:hypothetical protein